MPLLCKRARDMFVNYAIPAELRFGDLSGQGMKSRAFFLALTLIL